jgi:hypothetical protein
MNEYNDAKIKPKVRIILKIILFFYILFYFIILLSIGFVPFSFASNKMDS